MIKNNMMFVTERPQSKYWDTLNDILEGLYPKGCKERSKALVFLAYVEMMLLGFKFDEDGRPIKEKNEIRKNNTQNKKGQ